MAVFIEPGLQAVALRRGFGSAAALPGSRHPGGSAPSRNPRSSFCALEKPSNIAAPAASILCSVSSWAEAMVSIIGASVAVAVSGLLWRRSCAASPGPRRWPRSSAPPSRSRACHWRRMGWWFPAWPELLWGTVTQPGKRPPNAPWSRTRPRKSLSGSQHTPDWRQIGDRRRLVLRAAGTRPRRPLRKSGRATTSVRRRRNGRGDHDRLHPDAALREPPRHRRGGGDPAGRERRRHHRGGAVRRCH